MMGKKKSVLIIDDEPHIARLLKIHLCEHGYLVRIATNSIEGLKKAVTYQPDVITMDMMLSKVGLSLMKKLKRTKETKDIPIMVVTVADNQEKCLELGASCFMQKPFDGEKLVTLVNGLHLRN
jgi:DNA-binding response OmpR family regulator